MDYQTGIVAGYATGQDALLQRAGGGPRTGAAMRGFRVIYITVGFRPGYPEISPRNARFSALKEGGRFLSGPDAEVHPAVAPAPGDILVTKHRVSAFAGTDLEMILRANGIDTLSSSGSRPAGWSSRRSGTRPMPITG